MNIYHDPRSRFQVAQYLLHANDTQQRNEQNLTRWTKHNRDLWELRHVGKGRVKA